MEPLLNTAFLVQCRWLDLLQRQWTKLAPVSTRPPMPEQIMLPGRDLVRKKLQLPYLRPRPSPCCNRTPKHTMDIADPSLAYLWQIGGNISSVEDGSLHAVFVIVYKKAWPCRPLHACPHKHRRGWLCMTPSPSQFTALARRSC
eukprot:1446503-Amphidinium_carterae.1